MGIAKFQIKWKIQTRFFCFTMLESDLLFKFDSFTDCVDYFEHPNLEFIDCKTELVGTDMYSFHQMKLAVSIFKNIINATVT